jgi:hypothetical protein
MKHLIQNKRWMSSLLFIIPLIYCIIVKNTLIIHYLWIINNFILIFTSSCLHYYEYLEQTNKIFIFFQNFDHIILLNLSSINLNHIMFYLFGYSFALYELIKNNNIKITKSIIFIISTIKLFYILYISNKLIFCLNLMPLYGFKIFIDNDKRGYFLWWERIIWHLCASIELLLIIKYVL